MSFSYNFHDTYMYSGIINPNEKPMKNSWMFHELCIAFFDPMKKAMKKQNENIMNFHCKFMRFYLVVKE